MLGDLVVVLTLLFPFGEFIGEKVNWKKFWTYVGLAILTASLTHLQMKRADAKSDAEIKEKKQDVKTQMESVASLHKELADAEANRKASEMYYQGRLDQSYNSMNEKCGQQLAAVRGLTAEEKKAYDSKVQSSLDLYNFTMDLASKLEAFSYRAHERYEAARHNMTNAGLYSPEEFQKISQNRISVAFQMNEAAYRDTLLPSAQYAVEALKKQNVPPPQMEAGEISGVENALRGSLAGARPELDLAKYLRLYAKNLSH